MLRPLAPQEAIQRKNIKIADVVTSWDKDGDGVVSKAEFRVNVKELGVTDISSAALDELYDSLDSHGERFSANGACVACC